MEALPLGRTGVLGIAILFGILQGLSLAGVLAARRRGDPQSNRLLATLILVISLHLTEVFLLLTGLIELWPRLSGVTFALLFLVPPLFFLYGRRLLETSGSLRARDLVHAIPAVLILVDSWPWITAPLAQKSAYHALYQSLDIPPPGPRFLLILAANVVQHVIYVGLTLRRVRRHERHARESSADAGAIEALSAFRRVSTGFTVYVALYLCFFVALVVWGGYGVLIDTAWLVVLAFFIQAVGYVAIAAPETLSHALWADPDAAGGAHSPSPPSTPSRSASTPLPTSPVAASPAGSSASVSSGPNPGPSSPPAAKYERSSLSDEEARTIYDRLVDRMQADRLFLRRQLKLRDVAAHVEVSPHHLSQAINQHGEQNFFDFVNRFRVQEAQRLLSGPGAMQLTLLAVGFDAGFNNKASFNAAFRKFTGETPSAFRARSAAP